MAFDKRLIMLMMYDAPYMVYLPLTKQKAKIRCRFRYGSSPRERKPGPSNRKYPVTTRVLLEFGPPVEITANTSFDLQRVDEYLLCSRNFHNLERENPFAC
ncbi:hypothetical protein L2E82_27469 [Cichorium intybus]|uniref:Uncharacterized protein n=1 Tax=Cichorium intybus TaxID=13427 RepID=A0ACB9CTD4_CICIN|nr:hypothetical protein L2E82_27469 [Cichorium intybus]